MPDCIYLRKSRVDAEAESHGLGDTLARHEEALLRHAAAMGREIAHIYREVKSGETIAARPQMQQLLQDVETGKWDAVHVMEVERLARGDTLDQGIVSQTFLYSGTLIITPKKTYDPGNEFDEEYFEFGLFMSRREYKTINRRQQAGRLASIREGKWVANKAPYGYKRVKLQDQKGWSLTPVSPQSETVGDIFRWAADGYLNPDGTVTTLGPSSIAQRLNALSVPAPGGGVWQPATVREILRNEAYAGLVTWGKRGTKKTLNGGMVTVSRPRKGEDGYTRYPGLHPPLVDQGTYRRAQQGKKLTAKPGSRALGLKNPLAGLVSCQLCGRAMVRRPYQSGRQASLICPSSSCETMASDLAIVEDAILSALSDWFSGLILTGPVDPISPQAETLRLEQGLADISRELSTLARQRKRIHTLLEQEIYTPEQFKVRFQDLETTALALEQNRLELELERKTRRDAANAQSISLETPFPVLDAYWRTEAPEEKNRLLHSLVKQVIYSKTTGGRYEKSNLSLILFPLLPRR